MPLIIVPGSDTDTEPSQPVAARDRFLHDVAAVDRHVGHTAQLAAGFGGTTSEDGPCDRLVRFHPLERRAGQSVLFRLDRLADLFRMLRDLVSPERTVAGHALHTALTPREFRSLRFLLPHFLLQLGFSQMSPYSLPKTGSPLLHALVPGPALDRPMDGEFPVQLLLRLGHLTEGDLSGIVALLPQIEHTHDGVHFGELARAQIDTAYLPPAWLAVA